MKETALSWAQRLSERPGDVDFFTAVDVLSAAVGGEPVGASERFQDERLRLQHTTTLGFTRAELDAATVETGEGGPRARLRVNFFGLVGAVTPLPLHVAEEADRDDDHGETVRGVLDLFHHRFLSLLYHGARKLDYPRGFRESGKDPWTLRVLALLGVGERTKALSVSHLLRLAPVLASGVSSPQMLEAALKIALDENLGRAAVRCEPFTGEWMEIDRTEWSRLGEETSQVGITSVLGTSVLHRSGAARIVVGPLSGDNYKEFTPGGRAFDRATELLDVILDEPLHLEMVLEIQDMTYPTAKLGERRLGDDLWLARSGKSGLTTRMNVPLGRRKEATP